MKIPALINFSEKNKKSVFTPDSKEYKALESIRNSGEFKLYQNLQLNNGASVRYNVSEDVYFVQPNTFENNIIKENDNIKKNEKQILQDDEDIDIETNIDGLDDLLNYEDINNEEYNNPINSSEKIEPINNNQMQVISLDDLKSFLQQIIPGINYDTSVPIPSNSMNIPSVNLEGGKEALKKTYFQDTDETLDSEFEALDQNIETLENHIKNEKPYVDVIGGKPNKNNITPQPGIAALGLDEIDTEMDYTNPSGCFDFNMLNNSEVKNSFDMDINKYNSNIPEESFLGYEVPKGANRMIADLPYSDDYNSEEEGYEDDYNHDEDTELLLDVDEEMPVNGQDEDISGMMEDESDTIEEKHPDLDRFGIGEMDFTPEDNSDIINYDEEELAPDYEEEIVPEVNINKNMNLNGQQVQIILTGVMITLPELNYIGESVKKAGNKLKKIQGKGKQLNIIVEANNKQYTIDYLDQPKNKTKTPFSIKNNKFQSLEEALERINYKRGIRENDVFKKIITEDILKNEVSDIKGSNIFENLKENIKYTAGWNVMSVGHLNLKTCINETFSRITQTGKEPNTLILTENNEYFLIKGNMKERSKIGTKKEIVDMKENKSYGIAKVIGIYENTSAGLGEIMYKIKRTSIPLLVWK